MSSFSIQKNPLPEDLTEIPIIDDFEPNGKDQVSYLEIDMPQVREYEEEISQWRREKMRIYESAKDLERNISYRNYKNSLTGLPPGPFTELYNTCRSLTGLAITYVAKIFCDKQLSNKKVELEHLRDLKKIASPEVSKKTEKELEEGIEVVENYYETLLDLQDTIDYKREILREI